MTVNVIDGYNTKEFGKYVSATAYATLEHKNFLLQEEVARLKELIENNRKYKERWSVKQDEVRRVLGKQKRIDEITASIAEYASLRPSLQAKLDWPKLVNGWNEALCEIEHSDDGYGAPLSAYQASVGIGSSN